MIRSFAFTTQGRLHTKDLDIFLMPTLLADTNLFLWVDLEKPTPEESQTVLEQIFHFHPHLFMVIHAVDYSRKDGVFATSELNFFLGKNFLVTYHELPLKSVQSTEERCLRGTGHIARAPDRVAYTLLDGIVDNYKPALDELSFEIAQLENEAVQTPTKGTLNRLLQIKKEVLHLRHIVGPQREVLARFAHGEFKLIRPHLVPYYRDVYDELFHISELAQRYTDSLTGILQVYLNMSSNQTGEIIKVLTLFTVITTPITIVGTWYGMNFHGIHEYQWKYGYLMAIAITFAATGATIWWLKKKGWF